MVGPATVQTAWEGARMRRIPVVDVVRCTIAAARQG
jgi:hypothetical protein